MIVGYYSVLLGRRAAVASERAAEGTERSVQASKRAASLAAQDARYRRAEALLDAVLEMRELLNSQNVAHKDEALVRQPRQSSDEMLQRVALRRKLEGRLVPFEIEATSWTWVQNLFGSRDDWNTITLEDAIHGVRALMRSMIEAQ